MLPIQIIRKVLQEIREISGLPVMLCREDGTCVYADGVDVPPAEKPTACLYKEGSGDMFELVVCGEGETARLAARLGASQLKNMEALYREKMDKNRFICNYLLGNIPTSDAYAQAKKLRIPQEMPRAVFLVEPRQDKEELVLETLGGMFTLGAGDFVTEIHGSQVAVVKSLDVGESYPQIARIAAAIVDMLGTEAMVSTRVSYGDIASGLEELPESFRKAAMALEVGRVFYEEKSVVGYNELGIGRLIHQLPKSLCEIFLKEVLSGKARDLFDEEELMTVYTFFDNNLNISETARKLFIHRNTLTYRLEKIQKKTGLDVRVFDDAMTFKIAMMVERHVNNMNAQHTY